MNISFGYIETRGLIGAIEAADAMLKAAKVSLLKTERIGSALVTVIVKGELDACQAAVDAGQAAAARIGELISAHVIPNPYPDTELLTSGNLHIPEKDKAQQKKPDKPKPPSAKKPGKKTTSSKKQKDPSKQVSDLIRKSGSKGISLNELASATGQEEQTLRVIVKGLMDRNTIERVRHKYYWITGS